MDKQTTQRRRRRRRRRSNKGLIAALVIVILALLALIAYLILGNINDRQEVNAPPVATPTPVPTAQLAIDPNAGALITPSPAPTEPGVAIPGWGSMTIPAGVTEVATSMQNPETNEGWYYLTFELRLKETDEVIFTTGLTRPGSTATR